HGRGGAGLDRPHRPSAGAGSLRTGGPGRPHRGLGPAVVHRAAVPKRRPCPRRMGGWSLLWLVVPAVAGAQVVPNRATLYLHPSDVTDARAVWVNPAGSGPSSKHRFISTSRWGTPG